MKRLYSIKQEAEYLSVSTWTVHTMVMNGTLACVRLGKRILIAVEDLEALVLNNKEGGA
jgi:excisionase family DNA binding protein